MTTQKKDSPNENNYRKEIIKKNPGTKYPRKRKVNPLLNDVFLTKFNKAL